MTAATTGFASGVKLYLAKKLTPGGTLTVTTNPGPTRGRLFFKNDEQVEWIEYTTVTPSGTDYILGGLTRDLDPIAYPTVSMSTGKTWLATQTCVLVAMHDQYFNRQKPEPLVFATTADRDTALGGNGVATTDYFGVKVVSTGLFYNYNLSTGQWEAVSTGTVTPNASETVAGKEEVPTQAESDSGAETGGTGAYLSGNPLRTGRTIQKSSWVYATSADLTDTYTATLSPAPTAYATGMKVVIKFTTVNTGACTLNLNGLGAKSIKLNDGTDPLDGDIAAGKIYNCIYDGTNFVLQLNLDRATDSDATTGTNTLKFMTPATTKSSIRDSLTTAVTKTIGTNYQAATSGFVVCSSIGAGYSNTSNDTITGYVGASNPASTIIAGNHAQQVNPMSQHVSVTFPVIKGQWYRCEASTTAGYTSFQMLFIPNN